jgi:hypothetical protein
VEIQWIAWQEVKSCTGMRGASGAARVVFDREGATVARGGAADTVRGEGARRRARVEAGRDARSSAQEEGTAGAGGSGEVCAGVWRAWRGPGMGRHGVRTLGSGHVDASGDAGKGAGGE